MRYTTILALPQDLYAEGSPLIIRAAVLLADTLQGGLLAQMKLESIDPRPIRSLRVSVQPLDLNRVPVGEPVTYSYTGAERDTPFGQDKAFRLPDCAAFAPSVTEVRFCDDSLWQAEPSEWTPLEKPQWPDLDIWDACLREQYRLERGCELTCSFRETRGLWYCGCGAVNRSSEEVCHRCGQTPEAQRDLDPQAMRRRMEERRRREDLDREQQAREKLARDTARRRQLRLNAAIIGVLLAAVLTVGILWMPELTYRRGLAAMEAGEWRSAMEYFADRDFRDSAARYDVCLEQLKKPDRDFLEAFRKAAEAQPLWIQELVDGSLDADGAAERIRQEMDSLKPFLIAEFYDGELSQLLRQYYEGLSREQEAFADFHDDLTFQIQFNRAWADCSDIFWTLQDRYAMAGPDSPALDFFPRDTQFIRDQVDQAAFDAYFP